MKISIILPFIAFSLLFSSCDKRSSLPVYNISFAGVELEGKALAFNGGISCSKYEWNFGDGQKSTEAKPVHTYSTAGDYDISLIVNGQKDQAVHRIITIYKDPKYTAAMCNPRRWQHSRITALPGDTYSSEWFADTSFAIKYINPLVVIMGSDTVRIVGDNDDPVSLHYRANKYDASTKKTKSTHIYYYYGSDSIWSVTGWIGGSSDLFITKK